jgi:hypothetical protein
MVTLVVVPAAQSREAKRLRACTESTVLLTDSTESVSCMKSLPAIADSNLHARRIMILSKVA